MYHRLKTFVVLTILCSGCLPGEVQGNDAKSISKVFDKAEEIFKSEETKSTFKKVTTWMTVGGHLITAVYDLVKLINTFIGDNESKELKYLKKQFALVNTKMDGLDYEFIEVKELIDWSTVRVNFGEYERRIKAVNDVFRNYLSAPIKIKDIYKDIFVMSYTSHYGDAASKLFDGLISESHIFGENLFRVAMKFYSNDRVKLSKFGAFVCRIIQRGINVEAAYLELANTGTNIDKYKRGWEKKFKDLQKFVSKIDAEVVAAWSTQFKIDSDKLIVRNPSMKPNEMALALYHMLETKYPWRAWVIIVFPNTESNENRWNMENCAEHGFQKFNSGGKIIYINSADAGIKPFPKPETGLLRLKSLYSTVGIEVINSAKYVYDRIQSPSCKQHIMKGVFQDNLNAVIQGPKDRVSVKEVNMISKNPLILFILKTKYFAVLAN